MRQHLLIAEGPDGQGGRRGRSTPSPMRGEREYESVGVGVFVPRRR
jgi:hypothetical protein